MMDARPTQSRLEMLPISVILVHLALTAYLSQGCDPPPSVDLPARDWWETAQFYQIYPRSFQDSDGDGIGDLNGITSRLQHLKDIGVTATWLSPIFTSPMVDFGYDISDFYKIQSEYGTMADFENLIKEATRLGIKIVLDFVPNHSSDQNEWFKKSVLRQDGYDDFYVWHDGYPNPDDPSKRLPPCNWLSAFRGSAWQWVEERQQFYLHQFAVAQPDLNYREQKVVDTMKDVLRFWLGKGVAGFRVDAVPLLFEVEPASGRYPDEPLSGYTDDPENEAYLKHIYTRNMPETIDMTCQWRQVLDEYQATNGGDTRVLLIETYEEPSYTMQFYGTAEKKGAHLPFNFNLITQVNSQTTAAEINSVVKYWMDAMPEGRVANWVIGNHDQRRAGSRYGINRIDFMTMLVMLLPGVSVTYQGEEIGMIDGYISWDATVDPAACNSNPEIYEKFTRDPERTPFQWDTTQNAGFSTAAKTWLPVADSYLTRNVDVETKATKSHLKIYKNLVDLRQSKTLMYGSYRQAAIANNVYVLERFLTGEETLILIANLNGDAQVVNLATFDATLPTRLYIKASSISSSKENGAFIEARSLSLSAYEALVIGTRL